MKRFALGRADVIRCNAWQMMGTMLRSGVRRDGAEGVW